MRGDEPRARIDAEIPLVAREPRLRRTARLRAYVHTRRVHVTRSGGGRLKFLDGIRL
jgi:hypothetical protein